MSYEPFDEDEEPYLEYLWQRARDWWSCHGWLVFVLSFAAGVAGLLVWAGILESKSEAYVASQTRACVNGDMDACGRCADTVACREILVVKAKERGER